MVVYVVRSLSGEEDSRSPNEYLHKLMDFSDCQMLFMYLHLSRIQNFALVLSLRAGALA